MSQRGAWPPPTYTTTKATKGTKNKGEERGIGFQPLSIRVTQEVRFRPKRDSPPPKICVHLRFHILRLRPTAAPGIGGSCANHIFALTTPDCAALSGRIQSRRRFPGRCPGLNAAQALRAGRPETRSPSNSTIACHETDFIRVNSCLFVVHFLRLRPMAAPGIGGSCANHILAFTSPGPASPDRKSGPTARLRAWNPSSRRSTPTRSSGA